MTAPATSGAAATYAALKELVELADLAARHGWRLDRDHSVGNEIAWNRSGHRVVAVLTSAARFRRCGFGYQTEPDPLNADWRYDAAGALSLSGEASAPPLTMLFWERRDAGEVGLAGLVRRFLTAPPGIGVGDLVLTKSRWCQVISLAPGHVTVLDEIRGQVRPVMVGCFEIEARRFTPAVDELSAELAGRWLVISQGSTHLWDLDSMTYSRFPGPMSVGGFPCDGESMRITRVERWPAVGSTSMVWFDDPERPQEQEHWRQSSVIDSIVSAAAMGEESALAAE
ncbi:MAG: hypothetical protein O2892_12105 [Actinomycetota bacterium]|nr:hypothetical protein [Actinomycetota bacterium]MDA2949765.1 hypothetical protein [Actinomycetota bacterium]